MSEIQLTETEKSQRSIDGDRLALAADLLQSNGYLVIDNVLNSRDLEAVDQVLTKAWDKFENAKPAWRGGGRIIGHLGLVPPKCDDIVNARVLGNPVVWSIVSAALGGNVCITGIGGNINLPGSRDQSFHSDVEEASSQCLLVNVPIGNVNENNGSIELVPKSHVPENSGATNPVRVNTRSGTVILRYPHLLHRGRCNRSLNPRYMLGLWAKSLTPEQKLSEGLCLDPASKTILEDCNHQFEALGLIGEQPVFMPNYFAPTLSGLLKEITYCYAPFIYQFLADSRVKK